MHLAFHHIWHIITHLGAVSLMLPMMVMVVIGLWQTGQVSALRSWLLALTGGVALVLTTKIAFIGWGLGSKTLDFTGISGHTTLASSVLPVWLGWLLEGGMGRISRSGIALGLAVGCLVGWSLVVLGDHSPSEVVAGWLLGASISAFAYRHIDGGIRAPWLTKAAAVVLLFSFSSTLSSYLEPHSLEVRLALRLSGRSSPYTRHNFHRTAVGMCAGREQDKRGFVDEKTLSRAI